MEIYGIQDSMVLYLEQIKWFLLFKRNPMSKKDIAGFRFNPLTTLLQLLNTEVDGIKENKAFSRIESVLISNDYLVFSSFQISLSPTSRFRVTYLN
jgi:hypothetical protein